jgi:hypothetical protein
MTLVGLWLANLCSATTVTPPEFTTLVNDSDYIIQAVVKSVKSEKRSTERGTKIITEVSVDVIEVIAGKPPAQVTLEFLGGRVGDDEMQVEGMPQFKVGDEDILFVRDNGRTICPLYGMMHGRYAIRKAAADGRKHIIRSDGMPLHDTNQIASPLMESGVSEVSQRQAIAASLEPADFIRQIRAGIRPDARLNRAK